MARTCFSLFVCLASHAPLVREDGRATRQTFVLGGAGTVAGTGAGLGQEQGQGQAGAGNKCPIK